MEDENQIYPPEECCICLENEKRDNGNIIPWKILSCGHKLCLLCFDQLDKKICPLCREELYHSTSTQVNNESTIPIIPNNTNSRSSRRVLGDININNSEESGGCSHINAVWMMYLAVYNSAVFCCIFLIKIYI